VNLSEVQYYKNRSINTTIRTKECVTPEDKTHVQHMKGEKRSWIHWINTSITHKDYVNKSYYNKSYYSRGHNIDNKFDGGFSMRKTWKNKMWENMTTWTKKWVNSSNMTVRTVKMKSDMKATSGSAGGVKIV
jgi:hypothetical protein